MKMYKISLLRYFMALLLTLSAFSTYGQSGEEESKPSFGEQIFLPSLEFGYLHNNAQDLSGGILIKTSLEYRVRNNNDVFFRANYDTYNSDYTLTAGNNLTNVIKGTAAFTDLLLGGGYRFGDREFRIFLMGQAGVKYYNFPEFVQTNTTFNIEQAKRNVFTTRFTLGFEYYINEKSAFSVDILQGQVWEKKHFWDDSGSAVGGSIGFITSLF